MNPMRTRLILWLAAACIVARLHAANTSAVAANATNQFQITGMSCEGCARGIASELKRLSGVISADVTFGKKLAVVTYDTNLVSADGLKKAIIEAGYGAKLIQSPKAKRH
jgi:copper chaperone CopZ